MATKYLVEIAPDGSKDFTTFDAVTNTGGTGYLDTEWGATPFDDDVVIRVYDDGGDYTEQVSVYSTLTSTLAHQFIIEAAPGDSPVIDATGETYGIYISTKPDYVRITGIEVHSAIANLYLNGLLRVWLDEVHSHDCALDTGHLVEMRTSPFLVTDSIFSGAGFVYMRDCATTLFQRVAFSGGSPANYLFNINRGTGDIFFESCKFDGSSLTAGNPIISSVPANAVPQLLSFINCIAFDGDSLYSSYITPASLIVINDIFVDQGTGAFVWTNTASYPSEVFIHRIEANCYWNCGNFFVDGNGSYTTLAQLRAAGYDTLEASIDTDPDETSPFDGTIPNDSPCIEAGIGASVLLDLAGNSYANVIDHPSIGADGQWDNEDVPSITFAGLVTLTDNQNGTLTGSFAKATGDGADFYRWHIKTSAFNFPGDITSREFAAGTIDDDGSDTYDFFVPFIAGGVALLAPGTNYYVHVEAINNDTHDGNTVERVKVPTKPHANVGGSYTPIETSDYPPVLLGAGATDIIVCPPNNRMIVKIHFLNTDSAARTMTFYKVESGGSVADNRAQSKTKPLLAVGDAANRDEDESLWYSLGPGDRMVGLASVADKVTATPNGLLYGTA